MRLLLAALSIAIAGVATPASAQATAAAQNGQIAPESLAIAREIIDRAYPPERRQEMMSAASNAMMEQSRAAMIASIGDQLDDGARAILDRFLSRYRATTRASADENTAPLFEAFARAYARQFTREELIDIRAFVLTPSGTRFLQRSTDLLSDPDVARANTEYMRAALAAVQPLLEEMRQQLARHLAEQHRSAHR